LFLKITRVPFLGQVSGVFFGLYSVIEDLFCILTEYRFTEYRRERVMYSASARYIQGVMVPRNGSKKQAERCKLLISLIKGGICSNVPFHNEIIETVKLRGDFRGILKTLSIKS
jgi:hypothetical protein